jgi:hypothetical protein
VSHCCIRLSHMNHHDEQGSQIQSDWTFIVSINIDNQIWSIEIQLCAIYHLSDCFAVANHNSIFWIKSQFQSIVWVCDCVIDWCIDWWIDWWCIYFWQFFQTTLDEWIVIGKSKTIRKMNAERWQTANNWISIGQIWLSILIETTNVRSNWIWLHCSSWWFMWDNLMQHWDTLRDLFAKDWCDTAKWLLMDNRNQQIIDINLDIIYPSPLLPYWFRININSNIVNYQTHILFVICHMSYVIRDMSYVICDGIWRERTNCTLWGQDLSSHEILFHMECQQNPSQSRSIRNYLKHNAYCWFPFLVWQLIHVEIWSKLIFETIHLSCQNIQIMFLFSRSHYHNHFRRQIRYRMFEISMIM